MDHRPHRPGCPPSGDVDRGVAHDPGIDQLLRWIDDVLLEQAGAGWGETPPSWTDVAHVLESRSDLVVPVFRAIGRVVAERPSARDLLVEDAEAFVAVSVLAGLIASTSTSIDRPG